MSLRARRVAVLFGALVASWGPQAQAQTIADYSRAQRAWLENTMSQSAARSAGAAAPTASVAASAVQSIVPVVSSTSPRLALPMAEPPLQVSGVFASGRRAVAEIVVDATAYLVEAGQAVPGTRWQVDAIAVDQVVLGRRGAAAGGAGEVARRVFALPTMR